MPITTYLILVASIVLITDLSGWQDTFPVVSKLCIKHRFFNHLLRCSLCMTFWFTLISVLFFSIPLNALILPFFASSFSSLISSIINFLYWIASLLNKL